MLIKHVYHGRPNFEMIEEGEDMPAADLYKLNSYLQSNDITFCYRGYLTESMLFSIGEAIKNTLTVGEADKKTSKNAFSVFVEQVQNVIRYSAQRGIVEEDTEVSYGILTLGKDDGKVYIDCGNPIETKDVDKIKENLEKIKSLDRKELKALYKTILKGDVPEGSKGAGVGFIEVALRAKNGFDYSFVEIDSKNYFFSLKAYV